MRVLARGSAAAANLAATAIWLIHLDFANRRQNPATPARSGAGRKGGGNFHEPDPLDFEDHASFAQLFDGDALKDWDGNPDVWRLENDVIVAGSGTVKISFRNIWLCKCNEPGQSSGGKMNSRLTRSLAIRRYGANLVSQRVREEPRSLDVVSEVAQLLQIFESIQFQESAATFGRA